jgi:hypothetical protein
MDALEDVLSGLLSDDYGAVPRSSARASHSDPERGPSFWASRARICWC